MHVWETEKDHYFILAACHHLLELPFKLDVGAKTFKVLSKIFCVIDQDKILNNCEVEKT